MPSSFPRAFKRRCDQKPAGYGLFCSIPEEASNYRVVHYLNVGPPGKGSTAFRPVVHQEGDRLDLKVVWGREFSLSWPPWSLDDGRTGWIAVTRGLGRQTLVERRPLAAGVMPHTPEGVRLMDSWDQVYRDGHKPPWDIGRPSHEIVGAVEKGTIKPCRVVELGCGTGTDAIYLAQKGFDVTGLDIAPTALARAEAKAKKAEVRVRWLVADVLAPPPLGTFDFLFDRGCYSGLRGQQRTDYVKTAERLSHPGSRLLLLASNANEKRNDGVPRVTEEELRGDFSAWFEFLELRETHFDTVDPANPGLLGWLALLQRKANPQ